MNGEGMSSRVWAGGLAAVLLTATVPRFSGLGRLSYWYDEVVTARLAATANPAALVALLGRIDATRAPLHPLLLQVWTWAFGPSESSGRAFSALCGLATVAVVGRLGVRFSGGDRRVGLWASGLAAVSPLLVVYSREARMYAWLTLITCAAWDALLALRGRATAGRLAVYAAAVAALVYSHPLGLLMAGALGLALLSCRRAFGLSWGRFLAAEAGAALLIAPWVGRYLDHPPESTVGRLPLRFLVGTPIGFTGGNFLTLLGFLAVIAWGLVSRPRGGRGRSDAACLLSWLLAPPLLLYGYSWVAHPVFGPARYTLFVAPAYLILLAKGLVRIPVAAGLGVWLVAVGLSVSAWPARIFAPDLKADWRAAADALDARDPTGVESVVVIATDPTQALEVETARYYLGPRRRAYALGDGVRVNDGRFALWGPKVWVALAVRGGREVVPLPGGLRRDSEDAVEVAGLRLVPIEAGASVP